MAFTKYASRAYKGAKKAVKKRYVKKTGGLKYSKIEKDVKYLMGVLNPEKKRYNYSNVPSGASAVQVGQVNGNIAGGGWMALDVTPAPAQGVTDITRNGDSIKLASSDFKLQIFSQSANFSNVKLRYYIVSFPGIYQTSMVSATQQLVSANSFNGLYDFNSDRNYDKMNQVKVLRTGVFFIKSPGEQQGKSINNFRVGMKYKNYHIKFDNNTTTVTQGQIVLFLFADSGNSSSTTTSTVVNIPQTAINTGVQVNYDVTHFFYDN